MIATCTSLMRASTTCRCLHAEVLQPLVDEAHFANSELPLLREELAQASSVRLETLTALRRAQDAAEDERQQHLLEMTNLAKVRAEEKEQASFTTELQASQLEEYRKALDEATEELQNWRSGNIRLSNAKQWRRISRGKQR